MTRERRSGGTEADADINLYDFDFSSFIPTLTVERLRDLLELSTNLIEVRDINGSRLLIEVVRAGRLDLAKVLVYEHNALSFDGPDRTGRTAQDYARDNNDFINLFLPPRTALTGVAASRLPSVVAGEREGGIAEEEARSATMLESLELQREMAKNHPPRSQ